jgi:hypothetical protein
MRGNILFTSLKNREVGLFVVVFSLVIIAFPLLALANDFGADRPVVTKAYRGCTSSTIGDPDVIVLS